MTSVFEFLIMALLTSACERFKGCMYFHSLERTSIIYNIFFDIFISLLILIPLNKNPSKYCSSMKIHDSLQYDVDTSLFLTLYACSLCVFIRASNPQEIQQPDHETSMEVDSKDVMINFDVPPQFLESSIEDETVRQYDNDDMPTVTTYEVIEEGSQKGKKKLADSEGYT